MPTKKMERAAASARVLRLSAAAQAPAPASAPAPIPLSAPDVLTRVLGETYPGGEQRHLERTAAAEAHARAGERVIPAGFYRPEPGEFDCDCGCCCFCTRGLLPIPEPDAPPYYRRAEVQAGQEGPPAFSLPPEVEAELRAPFTARVEPSEEMWAEASLRLMCEVLAHAGSMALTAHTVHECRAMAYALLTGRELAS